MRWWPAALVSAAVLPGAAALYEDEVGQYEWRLQQIGQPSAFAYSRDAWDRVFVASESGAVASVLLKDGTMQWRRVSGSHGGVVSMRAAGRNLFTVTQTGVVQSWKAANGDLSWQREYSDAVLDLFTVGAGSQQNVVVLRDQEIEARSMNGKHEWSLPAASVAANMRFWSATTAEDGGICALAAAADGTNAVTVKVEPSTGTLGSKAEWMSTMPAVSKGLRRRLFLVAETHVVFLIQGTLSAAPICGGAGSEFELTKLNAGGGDDFRLLPWQHTPGVFAVTNGATTAVFGVGKAGLKHLRSFDGVAAVGPIASVHEDEVGQPIAVAMTTKEGAHIQLMDPASGNVQPAIKAGAFTSVDHGAARLVLMHELSSGEHYTVVSAADHSFVGIQGDKVLWTREEGLAAIDQAVFYTRSSAATLAERLARKPEDEAAMGAQLNSLPGALAGLSEPKDFWAAFQAWVTPKRRRSGREMKLMPDARVPTSSEELRDFGADKLIIAATRSSKLFAIEATTSEIVWQKYLGPPGEDCADAKACSPTLHLLPSGAAQVSELMVLAPSAEGHHQVIWFEPLAGTVLKHDTVGLSGARVASVVPLKRHDAVNLAQAHAMVQPFMLIDSKRQVHVLPAGAAESQALAEEAAPRLFHYAVNSEAQAVEGFAVSSESEGTSKKNFGLTRLWNLELGSAGEKVLTWTAPEHREWDHVPVHIKGDATILYKYINANLVAVATEDTSGNKTSLNLYVLDAVSGHVLHSSHIAGGAWPVHLAACDNWIIMHYHNPKKTRFEVTVVELFQAKADDGPWDIIFGGKQAMNQTKSAHHLEPPVPLQQTYIFPAGVTAMGVTATKMGITPRSLIMALSTEQIFRLSKDTLNPRRPYGAAGTKDKSLPSQFAPTKEEALMPYAPVLPLRPTDVLTYYNSLSQVEGIISSPSALESTSLVFAYGLDLFFVPVQSAKAYDVLSPGFNYVLLYLSVGVVVALWVVTSFWASRKALQDRWK